MTPIRPNLKSRVTQTDVARVAGVHNTTVSLALRNCESIPEATRKRIRAVADELGYYPDPTLQALVAYRKGRMPNRARETLAYVTHGETARGWRAFPAHEQAYLGAQRKAEELGYQLEHFWLGERGMSLRRLAQVLYHRGITGVLFGAQRAPSDELSSVEWSRLSAVKVGCFPRTPPLHRVTDDCGEMARIAVRRARAAGYQRIGLVLADAWDELADRAWSEGFQAEQSRHPGSPAIPVLRYAGSDGEWDASHSPGRALDELTALGRWFQAHRPEVVVGYSPLVWRQLEALNLAVPRDVAYLGLALDAVDDGVSGVRPNSGCVGEVAVSTLVGQLQQNVRGIPLVATTTLITGTWSEGRSLPRRRPMVEWTPVRPGSRRCAEDLSLAG